MDSVDISACDPTLPKDVGKNELTIQKNESTDRKNKANEENVDKVTLEDKFVDKVDNRQNAHENLGNYVGQVDSGNRIDEGSNVKSKAHEVSDNKTVQQEFSDKLDASRDLKSVAEEESIKKDAGQNNVCNLMDEDGDMESTAQAEGNQTTGEVFVEEKEQEPVFDGTEFLGSLNPAMETQGVAEKAAALKKFVREKSINAVSTFLRRLSIPKDEDEQVVSDHAYKDVSDSDKDNEAKEASQKAVDKSVWNPLYYIKTSRDSIVVYHNEQGEEVNKELAPPVAMKGRIILYTKLGCQECKDVRLFLYWKRLRYVEINIDIFPSRKRELKEIAGSSTVPKVFFNEIIIGGFSELKSLDESGELGEKIDYLVNEAPSSQAPLPPLSGEDDESTSGTVDELALIVQKMKESIEVKDRFNKMRRFTNSFLGSEAIDFLSEDQYLEREEAVEFGRKLASKLFFQHVLEENLLEDGNHLYRFLDDDPIVSSQCHNIPKGIIDVKPKPITEIASRLRFLSDAIYEAYTSKDGKHVDYRSIHGSEEFARYLRIVEELQRVEVQDMSREEKLAFFINLYNMMAIHAILEWGHPTGALEQRKLFGDFKYVIGGSTYSLSAIQNGILRGNQRPPYTLMKPFGEKDKRSKVALPYPEPLIHFAVVYGTRSGPALRCYSPAHIDRELMEAACSFLRGGGLLVDVNSNLASCSKILKWFSIDFGKNEIEVLKHASNYLEHAESQALLELLANLQLKVIYQPYDWGLNS